MSKRWLRRFHPAARSAPRLVVLPHGGGSASFYFSLSEALSPHVDVRVVQYPGRQDRGGEPAVTDLHELADAIAEQARLDGEGSLALFGHSMGALLAFESGARLERYGVQLSTVFVSAAPPPRVGYNEGIHLLPDAGLVEHLRKLSGTESSLLDEEILPLILPAVRADYQAVETYEFRDTPPLNCPLAVLVATDDSGVDPAGVEGWGEHTTATFEVFEFPGDHFYLVEERDAVAATIRTRLTPWAATNVHQVLARRRLRDCRVTG